MSFETEPPTTLTAAAGTFQEVISRLAARHAVSFVPTTDVDLAAADAVPAMAAVHFSAHVQTYYAVCAQDTAALDMVARILGSGNGSDPLTGPAHTGTIG